MKTSKKFLIFGMGMLILWVLSFLAGCSLIKYRTYGWLEYQSCDPCTKEKVERIKFNIDTIYIEKDSLVLLVKTIDHRKTQQGSENQYVYNLYLPIKVPITIIKIEKKKHKFWEDNVSKYRAVFSSYAMIEPRMNDDNMISACDSTKVKYTIVLEDDYQSILDYLKSDWHNKAKQHNPGNDVLGFFYLYK